MSADDKDNKALRSVQLRNAYRLENDHSYRSGRQDERGEILSIIVRAIHQNRMNKQSTASLEEVLAAIRARNNVPTPTQSSTTIPAVQLETNKKETR